MLKCRLVSLFLLLVSSAAFATETPPTGHAIGSAGFNEMLGKQLGADSLKTEQLPDGSFKLTNTIQTLSAHVHKDGVSFDSIGNSAGKGGFSLSLTQWGREGKLQPVVSSSIYSKDNIVYHTHNNGLAEKFSNTSDGIRQDFIVATKPEGAGSLLVQLQVKGGNVQAKNTGATIVLDSGRQLTYDRLAVTDANGKSIPAQITVASNNAINIVVEDSAAQYPLTIDPTVGDENWVSMGGVPGADAMVRSVVCIGSDVYIGGEFEHVGNDQIRFLAKWNGSGWSALGSGVNDVVLSMTSDQDGNLYVAGAFTQAGGLLVNRIAKWNGGTWSSLGSGLSAMPFSIAIDSNKNIYAVPSGFSNSKIFKWDGNTWSKVGPDLNGYVHVLACDQYGNLYAGGHFTNAGGVVGVNYFARWNGISWANIGTGVNYDVRAIVFDSSGNMYIGGDFGLAGGIIGTQNIAKWDGSSWAALDSGMNGTVYALAIDESNNLYVGGDFDQAGGLSAANVAKWDGSLWSSLGGGTIGSAGSSGWVRGLAINNMGNVYIGGDFGSAGDVVATAVAEWNGSSWSGLYTGSTLFNGPVGAMAFGENGNLYVGGGFTRVGNLVVNGITMWDGSSWHPLGSGVAFTNSVVDVSHMVIDSADNLYIAGTFTSVGGVIEARSIAKWNGNSWSALGNGAGYVYAMAIDQHDNIYVGNHTVYKWNGTSWRGLGSGITHPQGTSYVFAITVDTNDHVYVGGHFSLAGGIAANNIAKWNGTQWSALGSGVDNYVWSLAVDSHDHLYAGGDFTMAGWAAVSKIAKWDGVGWRNPGFSADGSVNKILIDSNDNLILSGGFSSITPSDADPISAEHIAIWNGSSVLALGSGISFGSAYSMVMSPDGYLMVGGDFKVVGNEISAYLAKWLFLDTDDDGLGDEVDADDDNDGVDDMGDAFPLDTTESVDTDSDGTGNNADYDDDDGVDDIADDFPLNASISKYIRHDTDIDGDSDLLTRSASLGTWTRHTIQNAAITGTGSMNAYTSSSVQYIAQLDANGDGDADLLTRNTSTGAWYLHQVQAGAVTGTTPIYLYANLDQQFIGAGDFNGDGTDDVMLRSASGGYYTVFLLSNHGVSSTVFYNAWSSSASVPQGVGDFDGDGTDDLLVRRTSDNLYFVFKTTNGATANSYCACNIWNNPDWTFQFAGDTNKDGTDDIVVRGTGATGNGQWWNFRMSNFSSTQTTNLNTFLNKTQVSFAASGDYNTDGHTDMLIRVNNGPVYVARIVNGLVSGSTTLLANLPADSVVLK